MAEVAQADAPKQGQKRKVGRPLQPGHSVGVATRFKPGSSGNPAGLSARHRLAAAGDKLITKAAAERMWARQIRIACEGEKDGDSTSAFHELRTTLGLGQPEAQTIVVETKLAFVNRRDGSAPVTPLRCSPEDAKRRVLSGPKEEADA